MAARLTMTVDGRKLTGTVFLIRRGDFVSVVIGMAPDDGVDLHELAASRAAAKKMSVMGD